MQDIEIGNKQNIETPLSNKKEGRFNLNEKCLLICLVNEFTKQTRSTISHFQSSITVTGTKAPGVDIRQAEDSLRMKAVHNSAHSALSVVKIDSVFLSNNPHHGGWRPQRQTYQLEMQANKS